MRNGQIRRPMSGAVILRTGSPAVSLRSTAGFIPSRPSGALGDGSAARVLEAQMRSRLRDLCPLCDARTVSLRVGSVARFFDGSAPEARRSRARSEAQRNSGNGLRRISKPLEGVAESEASKVAFIKRQTMRPQDHLELFEKRNRAVMFFLLLDITSHLRNLRFTHGEGAISFLPSETRGSCEGPRNPARRVSLYLTDKLGQRLVLSQFRQDVNVVGGSINNQRDAAFAANRTAEIFVNSRPDCRRDPRFTTLGRKDNMIQKIAMGGTHIRGPFRRPFSGATLFFDNTPGSFAALHCRLYSAAPPALCLSGLAQSAHEARRTKTLSVAQRNAGIGISTLSQSLGNRLYSAAAPAPFPSIRAVSQRRRRDGLKPRAKCSGARGNHRIKIFKPQARGDGEGASISTSVGSR